MDKRKNPTSEVEPTPTTPQPPTKRPKRPILPVHKHSRKTPRAVSSNTTTENQLIACRSKESIVPSLPTKRFVWSKELNRDFSSTIFRIGLHRSKPTQLQEEMEKEDSNGKISCQQTLQYLLRYKQKASNFANQVASNNHNVIRASSVLPKSSNHVDPTITSSCGISDSPYDNNPSFQDLHHVNYTDQQIHLQQQRPRQQRQPGLPESAVDRFCSIRDGQRVVMLSNYTQNEISSPHGIAMGHLLGLYVNLRHELMAQRRKENMKNAERNVPVLENSRSSSSNRKNKDTTCTGTINGVCSDQSMQTQGWDSVIQQLVNTSNHPYLDHDPSSKGRRNLEVSGKLNEAMESQQAFRHQLHVLKRREVEKYGAGRRSMNDNDRGEQL